MVSIPHKKQQCPIAKTARLLSDTWTMLIMRDIIAGPARFSELERSLTGISTRTLALKLKNLEHDSLIKKVPDGTYHATARGKALRTVENAMRRYGEKFL